MRRGTKRVRKEKERERGVRAGDTRLVLRNRAERARVGGGMVCRGSSVGKSSLPSGQGRGTRHEGDVGFTSGEVGERRTARSFARQRTRAAVVVHKRYQPHLHIPEARGISREGPREKR